MPKMPLLHLHTALLPKRSSQLQGVDLDMIENDWNWTEVRRVSSTIWHWKTRLSRPVIRFHYTFTLKSLTLYSVESRSSWMDKQLFSSSILTEWHGLMLFSVARKIRRVALIQNCSCSQVYSILFRWFSLLVPLFLPFSLGQHSSWSLCPISGFFERALCWASCG